MTAQVSREVFWATDANNNRSVLAIQFGLPTHHQQTVYQVKETDFPDKSSFSTFKDLLFVQWKDGEKVEFPAQIQTFIWDINEHTHFPSQLPQPERTEKLPFLIKRARKEVLQQYSTTYKNNLLENISAFREKVTSSPSFQKEDYDFAQKYRDLIRAARNNSRKLEDEGAWEEECLIQQDEKEVLALLDDVFLHLNKLKETVSQNNYSEFSNKITEIEALVAETTEWKETREKLLTLKNELRETYLDKVPKDELYDRLNKAFDALSVRQLAERQQYEQESQINFAALNAELDQQAEEAEVVEYFLPVREALKKIQVEIRESKLTRDQRTELLDKLDKAFKRVTERQTSLQSELEKASGENYTRLKDRLEIGTKLANFSDDFNEAREYLKDVQADINEVKLLKAQREELRQVARNAFEKLNERADKYYKDKRFAYEKVQKEKEEMRLRKRESWEFRQKERIMRLEQDIQRIEKTLQKDHDFAAQLKEELEVEEEDRLRTKLAKVEGEIAERQAKIEKIRSEIAEIEAELNKE